MTHYSEEKSPYARGATHYDKSLYAQGGIIPERPDRDDRTQVLIPGDYVLPEETRKYLTDDVLNRLNQSPLTALWEQENARSSVSTEMLVLEPRGKPKHRRRGFWSRLWRGDDGY